MFQKRKQDVQPTVHKHKVGGDYMKQFKNESVRYINGYKVTSRSEVLTPEKEEERICEIREAFEKVIKSVKSKELTA